MYAYVITVHTKIGTSGDCIYSCIPLNQYSALVTGALQSVDSCCLIFLQVVALSDLVVPMDGDNLWNIIHDDI